MNHAKVPGRTLVIYIILGIPVYYESFMASDKESVVIMESLGESLFDIMDKNNLRRFPIEVVSNVAIQMVMIDINIKYYLINT